MHGNQSARGVSRLLTVFAVAILVGCSDQDDMPVDPGDTTAPGSVLDLRPIATTDSSVTLEWAAPGDDGAAGTASIYDLRYAESPIGEDNWSAAGGVANEPAPLAGGATQTHTVSGLADSTTYYFALRTFDEASNASVLSNNATATTRLTVNPYGSAEYATMSGLLRDGLHSIAPLLPALADFVSREPGENFHEPGALAVPSTGRSGASGDTTVRMRAAATESGGERLHMRAAATQSGGERLYMRAATGEPGGATIHMRGMDGPSRGTSSELRGTADSSDSVVPWPPGVGEPGAGDCPTFVWTVEARQASLAVDYGEGCTAPDGVFRSGSYTLSGEYRVSTGLDVSALFDAFVVDDGSEPFEIGGTYDITGTRSSLSIAIDGTITRRIFESSAVAAEITMDVQSGSTAWDTVFLIQGTSSITSGASVVSLSLTQVEWPTACYVPLSGLATLRIPMEYLDDLSLPGSDDLTVEFDFSAPAHDAPVCDGIALVTIGLYSEEIEFSSTAGGRPLPR